MADSSKHAVKTITSEAIAFFEDLIELHKLSAGFFHSLRNAFCESDQISEIFSARLARCQDYVITLEAERVRNSVAGPSIPHTTQNTDKQSTIARIAAVLASSSDQDITSEASTKAPTPPKEYRDATAASANDAVAPSVQEAPLILSKTQSRSPKTAPGVLRSRAKAHQRRRRELFMKSVARSRTKRTLHNEDKEKLAAVCGVTPTKLQDIVYSEQLKAAREEGYRTVEDVRDMRKKGFVPCKNCNGFFEMGHFEGCLATFDGIHIKRASTPDNYFEISFPDTETESPQTK